MESAHRDFEDLCKCLNASGVEYLIVGAHALAYHGAPRFTGDFDVFVGPSPDNVQRLLRAIAEFWAPVEGVSVDELTGRGKILQMGREPWQIHVMTAISGVTWDDAWRARETDAYGETPAWFIGRAEFVRNKLASGRPKDLADVEELEATRRAEPSA
jgi:hypothetical protein